MRKYVVIGLAAACCGLGTTSCLDSPCGSALPVIQGAMIYADDAEASLNRIQIAFDAMNLPEAEKKRINDLLGKAWDALRAAQAALIAANSACTQIDARSIFSDFVGVWKALTILFAENSERLGGVATEGAFDPMIVKQSDGVVR